MSKTFYCTRSVVYRSHYRLSLRHPRQLTGHCGFFVSEVAVSSGAVVSAVVGATVVSDALLKAEAVSVAWGAVEVSVLF